MRIRSIRPEFWRSRDIAHLSLEDRLLFIGLWSYVDDNGVGPDEEECIIGDLFAADMFKNPRETVARVSRGLQKLSEASLIERYEVDGRRFIHIPTWKKHQRIDKPGKERYPLPDPDSRESRESVARTPESFAPGEEEKGEGEKGRRREDHPLTSFGGAGGGLAPDQPAEPVDNSTSTIVDMPTKTKRGTRLPADWKPSRTEANSAVEEGHPMDWLAQQLDSFCDYWHAKTGQQATKLDWDATWRNWLRRANDQPGRRRPQPSNQPDWQALAARAQARDLAEGIS